MESIKAEFSMRHSLVRTVLAAAAVAAAYYLGSIVGFALRFPSTHISAFWPPNAILLAALLVTERRRWWIYLLAVLPAHLVTQQHLGRPFEIVLVNFAGNAGQALLGAWAIVRFVDEPRRFDRLRSVTLFMILGGILAPVSVSFAVAGAFVLIDSSTNFWFTWLTRSLTNTLAVFTLVPPIVLAGTGARSGLAVRSLRRSLEAGVLCAGLLVVSVFVFLRPSAGAEQSPGLLYASLMFLLWATVRFGPVGVCLSILTLGAFATWGAMQGRGPFATQLPAENVTSLVLFLSVTCAPLLMLAALLEERKQAAEVLRESEDRYREVVESQTELVCRYLPDTTLTFVNAAYCRYFGKRREELLGRKFLELIPGPAREGALRHVESLARDPRVVADEHEVFRLDGSIGWQQWVDHAILAPDGRVLEFQAIGRDITDRKRAEQALRENEAALRASYEQIRDLAGRLITAQEAERRRIASELHDDVNQQLAALSITLGRLKRWLPADAEAAQGELARLQQLTAKVSEEIRHLSHELHPGALQYAGLPVALRGHCAEFGSQHAIEVTFVANDDLGALSPEVALCLYRVAQEALHNVATHAKARHVQMDLARTEFGLELTIADDGRGFDLEEARAIGGLGLISLDERVRLVGGSLKIDTQPGHGTALRVQVPPGR